MKRLPSKSEAEGFFAWVKKHEIPERDKISGYVPEKLKDTDMGERLKDQYMQAKILSDMLIEYRNEVE